MGFSTGDVFWRLVHRRYRFRFELNPACVLLIVSPYRPRFVVLVSLLVCSALFVLVHRLHIAGAGIGVLYCSFFLFV